MIPALEPAACLASAWQVAPDLPLRLGVILGLVAVAGWSAGQRPFPGRRSFFWLNVVLALWVLGSTAEHAAAAADCKGSIALVAWPMIALLPPLWTLFIWQYTGRRDGTLEPRRWAPVAAAWAVLSAAILSNGQHGLFYAPGTQLGPVMAGLPRMQYARGPLFAPAAAWGYAWLTAATVLLVRAVRDCAPGDRRQWIALLLMTLVPWGANIAFLGFGLRFMGGDPTPLSFAIGLVGYGFLIRHSSLLTVVPMSRRLLFTELLDPVLVLDSAGRVVDCNVAGLALADGHRPGAAPAAWRHQGPRAVAAAHSGRPLEDWPVFGRRLGALLEHAGAAGGTLVLDDPGIVFDVQVLDLRPAAQSIGRLLHLRDVTDRHRAATRLTGALAQRDRQLEQVAQLEAELREQARRDPLTGLNNRRALAERFAVECRHLRDTGQPLSLVLLDVDHFKRINDGFGHAEGDAVLQALGRTLSEGLRASDGVFRVGGEEFALLLPGADGAQALARVEALRGSVGERVRLRDGGRVGFSAGIATGRDGLATLDDLLRQADAALYAAKAAGRGQTMSAAEDGPEAASPARGRAVAETGT